MQPATKVHAKQARFLQSMSRLAAIIAGRGSGKSFALGLRAYQCVQQLPRSNGAILGLTYANILTKIIPSMRSAWTSLGLVEHTKERPGHYVIGQRPPDSWPRPYSCPEYWKNVISFCNGSVISLLSLDSRQANRGGSYDYLICDEAVLINKPKHDTEVLPSIRGNATRFPDHPLHQSRCYMSSQSWTQEGMWIADMANMEGVYYDEWTAYDNLENVGATYMTDMRQAMPDLVYRVEMLNEKLPSLPDGFYPSLSTSRHVYYDAYEYTEQEVGITATQKDVDINKPLLVSFDFGGRFNCMVVGQEHPGELRVVRNLYTTGQISQLLTLFTTQYASHKKKVVEIHGDRNGNNRQANSDETFYQQIQRLLHQQGWQSQSMVKGLDPFHRTKYTVINTVLDETRTGIPRVRINGNTCKELLISMSNAPVNDDFGKDKRSERQQIPQERATHLSDAFDNLVYPKTSDLVMAGNTSATQSAGVRIIGR